MNKAHLSGEQTLLTKDAFIPLIGRMLRIRDVKLHLSWQLKVGAGEVEDLQPGASQTK